MSFESFLDDHEVVRKGLAALLQGEAGYEICGEASDGRAAMEKIRELKPDVSILDIGMPGLNGLEATRQIIKDDPRAKVLILTLHDSDQVVREVLNAGARGFLLKSDAERDLVVAVEALWRDKTYFTSKLPWCLGIFESGTHSVPARLDETAHSSRARSGQLLAEGKVRKLRWRLIGVKTMSHRSNIAKLLLVAITRTRRNNARNHPADAGIACHH
jgi:DNA-binding NarL/FixJ family response regulator